MNEEAEKLIRLQLSIENCGSQCKWSDFTQQEQVLWVDEETQRASVSGSRHDYPLIGFQNLIENIGCICYNPISSRTFGVLLQPCTDNPSELSPTSQEHLDIILNTLAKEKSPTTQIVLIGGVSKDPDHAQALRESTIRQIYYHPGQNLIVGDFTGSKAHPTGFVFDARQLGLLKGFASAPSLIRLSKDITSFDEAVTLTAPPNNIIEQLVHKFFSR
jgi:hypothetical protein